MPKTPSSQATDSYKIVPNVPMPEWIGDLPGISSSDDSFTRWYISQLTNEITSLRERLDALEYGDEDTSFSGFE